MNKDRRKQIARAIKVLQQAGEAADEARNLLEEIASDERDYYDNMPENMQNGERGQMASDAADKLDEVVSAIEEFNAEQLIADLEEAAQ